MEAWLCSKIAFAVSLHRQSGKNRTGVKYMNTRVVVTGMGAITPIGNSVEAFWTAVKSNTVGIAPITHFDTADFK